MTTTQFDTGRNPFSRFIPIEDYVSARPEIFQTKTAPKHLLRYRGVQLQEAGALLNAGRRLMVDPELADKLILAIFRKDGSIKPPSKCESE